MPDIARHSSFHEELEQGFALRYSPQNETASLFNTLVNQYMQIEADENQDQYNNAEVEDTESDNRYKAHMLNFMS